MPDERIAIGRWIVAIISFFVILILLFSAVVTIPAGHVGVYDLFGVVDDSEYSPGLHLKNPLARVTTMSVKTQEYTMSWVSNEGAKTGIDVISALTKEGLSVDLDITILYRLNSVKASNVYKEIGTDYISVIVRPQIRTVIREVVAQYEAKQIYSQDRTVISQQIYDQLEPELSLRGIILERVLLRHVQLPTELTNAIEDKLKAEQMIEKKRFEVQTEIEEANRKIVEAEGIANATRIIKESLRASPEYLTYLWLQKLENHNSVVYVMDGEVGLPIFKNIDQQ